MNDHDGVLTHLDEQGAARMVDVSAKAVTLRRARASGAVLMKPSTLDMICHGTAAKGDVIATARIAGIMAAKRTGELIPLCHPLGIEAVTVTLEPQGADRLDCGDGDHGGTYGCGDGGVDRRYGDSAHGLRHVQSSRPCHDDHGYQIGRKSGGRSGHYRRHDADVKPSDGGSTEDGC